MPLVLTADDTAAFKRAVADATQEAAKLSHVRRHASQPVMQGRALTLLS